MICFAQEQRKEKTLRSHLEEKLKVQTTDSNFPEEVIERFSIRRVLKNGPFPKGLTGKKIVDEAISYYKSVGYEVIGKNNAERKESITILYLEGIYPELRASITSGTSGIYFSVARKS